MQRSKNVSYQLFIIFLFFFVSEQKVQKKTNSKKSYNVPKTEEDDFKPVAKRNTTAAAWIKDPNIMSPFL